MTKISFAANALLASLTCFPLLLSVLSLYPARFAAHPVQHFVLGLAPWWLAYLSARWYVRLAEQSSSWYHPLGCLAQCCVWVFHWAVSVYHAFFVAKYAIWTYLVTIFCASIVVVTEGLFHGLVTMGFPDTANFGVYERARKSYGKGLIVLIRLWYSVDAGTPQQEVCSRVRTPLQSRSMTV